MSESEEPKIRITEGPYLVSGNLPLQKETIVSDDEGFSCGWQKTGSFPTDSTYSLCRCGGSSAKPFCDGSHHKTDFNKEEVSQGDFLENAQRFEGPRHILLDNYNLCASARFCDRSGSAWDLIKHDDEKSSNDLVQECANCPSGRLAAYDKSTGQEIEPDLKQEISVTEDPGAGVSGPYWVKGGIEIESASGEKYETRNRVTLCRCGKSKNMPLCDSSHIEIKFSDTDKEKYGLE